MSEGFGGEIRGSAVSGGDCFPHAVEASRRAETSRGRSIVLACSRSEGGEGGIAVAKLGFFAAFCARAWRKRVTNFTVTLPLVNCAKKLKLQSLGVTVAMAVFYTVLVPVFTVILLALVSPSYSFSVQFRYTHIIDSTVST